jgi:hypothetical protein
MRVQGCFGTLDARPTGGKTSQLMYPVPFGFSIGLQRVFLKIYAAMPSCHRWTITPNPRKALHDRR